MEKADRRDRTDNYGIINISSTKYYISFGPIEFKSPMLRKLHIF